MLSFAKIAVKQNYVRPTINQTKALNIKEGRHPVIEQNLPLGEPYVSNDVFLDDQTQQIIMITGPNMCGKSALLRQTALMYSNGSNGKFCSCRKCRNWNC